MEDGALASREPSGDRQAAAPCATSATTGPRSAPIADHGDRFAVHRPFDKAWVETLAKNLRRRGYKVFYDAWVLVPGRPFVDALARERSRKAVLVATPEAVESGWVRLEYEAMVARGRRDRDFSFVPLVFGDVHELRMPFFETVHCVDFRDPAADAYRRAFHRLLCGLEDRPPGPDDDLDGDLEFPEPLHPAEAPAPSAPHAFSDVYELVPHAPDSVGPRP